MIFILGSLRINSEQNDCLTEEVYGRNGLKIQLDDSAKQLLVRGPAMTRPFASPECRADFKRRLAEFFGIQSSKMFKNVPKITVTKKEGNKIGLKGKYKEKEVKKI